MNLYSPHYDPDENRTIMSIDENGSWVHIKTVQELVKQNEQLKQKILTLEQVSGTLCDKCGWAMKFPGEPCRCELEEKVKLLRSALDILFDEATNSSNIYTHDGWNVRNPYLELPKNVEEQVREALRVTRDNEDI